MAPCGGMGIGPCVQPKVTENIDNIIAMIGTIIDNGHAYAVEGDVYFAVPSLPGYGQLSGRKLVRHSPPALTPPSTPEPLSQSSSQKQHCALTRNGTVNRST